jgi:hypothetical protein
MARDECSTRLLPGYDDDEVESPPFRFDRFEQLMAASHLAHIRHPAESSYGLTEWFTRLAPHWRWAQAHHCLRHKDFTSCDEDTIIAFELLNARAGEFNLYPGIHPLVEAILIYERSSRIRWLLEAHLLLPEPPTNLAQKLRLHPVTVRMYERWFFDVRRWLKKSSWINARALGGCAWFGFADDDLGPIWRRMAYYSRSERVLDITVAVTTGTGRERFSDDECDQVQCLVESMRLSPLREPDRVIQLRHRLEAERRGAHPSSYHMARRYSQPASRVTDSGGPSTDFVVTSS